MKKKIVSKHMLECRICFEVERRGYRSEKKYWDDWFAHKEKPIKYILREALNKK